MIYLSIYLYIDVYYYYSCDYQEPMPWNAEEPLHQCFMPSLLHVHLFGARLRHLGYGFTKTIRRGMERSLAQCDIGGCVGND